MALPRLDETAKAHSAALLMRIRAEIEANDGSIGFDQYMHMALYDSEFGYYRSGASKFGPAGDFTTAPEISPLFAQGMARVCARVHEDIVNGGILEIGAGTGRLAAVLLLQLEKLESLPRFYNILELSAALRTRQQQTIDELVPHLSSRVHWLDRLDRDQFSGIVIANEVLDAMPVICFCLQNGRIYERRVAQTEDGSLVWQKYEARRPITEHVLEIFAELNGLPDYDYCSEYNPWLPGWLKTLADHLKRGLMLLVDYGYERREYYHPQRSDGTLLCHYRQHANNDPFVYPGLQDISANVDFTAVALAAQAQGLDVLAYSTQAQFLLAQGILDDLTQNRDGFHELQHLLQVKSLILPTGMGERFHVIAMGKDYAIPSVALALRDQRNRL